MIPQGPLEAIPACFIPPDRSRRLRRTKFSTAHAPASRSPVVAVPMMMVPAMSPAAVMVVVVVTPPPMTMMPMAVMMAPAHLLRRKLASFRARGHRAMDILLRGKRRR
jgi:hypothetical protein